MNLKDRERIMLWLRVCVRHGLGRQVARRDLIDAVSAADLQKIAVRVLSEVK
jgi:hypothetical protein